jgi:hypothetical protein
MAFLGFLLMDIQQQPTGSVLGGGASLVAAISKLPGIKIVSSCQESGPKDLASVTFDVTIRGGRPAADAAVCRLLRNIQEALRRAGVAGHLSFHLTDEFSSCDLSCAPADVVRAAKAIERRRLLITGKARHKKKPVPQPQEKPEPQIEKPVVSPIEIDWRTTKEREFYVPIVEVLVELGGSGRSSYVEDFVGQKMSQKLTTADRETLRKGSIRWRKTVQFARFRMAKEGLLEPKSLGYGVWTLTDEGWKFWQRVLESRKAAK